MRLLLETSAVSFQVTRAAEARKDYGKDVQKVDRESGRPQWVVEVLAQDSERGEVIRVTVTGDQPKVSPGQQVRFEGLEAIAWNNNGKSGVAYRAEAIHPAQQSRAA
jgi:hypothetical protein